MGVKSELFRGGAGGGGVKVQSWRRVKSINTHFYRSLWCKWLSDSYEMFDNLGQFVCCLDILRAETDSCAETAVL